MESMLPALPKSFGRLSDVFVSALGSISGHDNRLALARAKSAAVIMVDGLGSDNIRKAAGHAPFLNQLLVKNASIGSVFPSTTAAALTSFGTGLAPGEHGILGYSVFDRDQAKTVNMLNGWGTGAAPDQWQPNQTVAQIALEAGVETLFVGPAEYEGSGFTDVIMRGAGYRAAKTIGERLSETKSLLADRTPKLVYCYIPELDQIAHASGTGSAKWLAAIEELNAELVLFCSGLPDGAGVLLTADHGVLDVPASNHIFLDELIPNEFLAVTGDPRCQFMYLADSESAEAVASLVNNRLGSQVLALTRAQAVSAGLYGANVSGEIIDRMPDVFVVATKNCAMYHRRFASPKSLHMIGQHGGLSDVELLVPLLKMGAYA